MAVGLIGLDVRSLPPMVDVAIGTPVPASNAKVVAYPVPDAAASSDSPDEAGRIVPTDAALRENQRLTGLTDVELQREVVDVAFSGLRADTLHTLLWRLHTPGCPNLRVLNLKANRGLDDGVAISLARVLPGACPALECVDLSGPPVGSRGRIGDPGAPS